MILRPQTLFATAKNTFFAPFEAKLGELYCKITQKVVTCHPFRDKTLKFALKH